MSQNLRVPQPVRKLDFRVFQHATEKRDKVLSALRYVSGVKTNRESRAEGYHGNPIIIIETELTAKKEVALFWERLRDAGLFSGIEENLEERINEQGELFIRFDKQAAVEERLELSSGDDVIAARTRVFCREGGREVRAGRWAAVEEMRRFLRGGEKDGGQGAGGGGRGTDEAREEVEEVEKRAEEGEKGAEDGEKGTDEGRKKAEEGEKGTDEGQQ